MVSWFPVAWCCKVIWFVARMSCWKIRLLMEPAGLIRQKAKIVYAIGFEKLYCLSQAGMTLIELRAWKNRHWHLKRILTGDAYTQETLRWSAGMTLCLIKFSRWQVMWRKEIAYLIKKKWRCQMTWSHLSLSVLSERLVTTDARLRRRTSTDSDDDAYEEAGWRRIII